MDISFASAKLRKTLNSERETARIYGDRIGDKIQQRIKQIRIAEALSELREQSGRCHELKGGRKGQLAIDLAHPFRLIFLPLLPISLLDDGGLDWTKVTAIRIIEITDYH